MPASGRIAVIRARGERDIDLPEVPARQPAAQRARGTDTLPRLRQRSPFPQALHSLRYRQLAPGSDVEGTVRPEQVAGPEPETARCLGIRQTRCRAQVTLHLPRHPAQIFLADLLGVLNP